MDCFIVIKSMLDYIENRVADEISLEQVAMAAGFSVPHFRAVFRDTTGQTLAKYITHRRLCHAALELARTRKTVSEIAMEYGFGSHDVFIRAFKRAFGDTPTDFRRKERAVSNVMIVPGVFGPTVFQKEDLIMDQKNQTAENKEYGTLYGVVPRVSYFEQQAELTPFISSLRACLTYMGQNIHYARLMAGSGAAFRLMWNLHCWDGGNVDIMAIREDATEPMRRAFRTAGRGFRMICKPGKEGHFLAERSSGAAAEIQTGGKKEFTQLVKEEISAGHPVIAFGVIGPAEACIIAGYRDDGETVVGWNFFQDMPEFAGNIEKEPCGYFIRKGWYEYSETIAVVAIGEREEQEEERIFLQDTLLNALTIMETPQVNAYAGGFAAYQACADALLRESEFPKDAPLPMLMERLMCVTDVMTMIGEGRWNAYLYLDYAAGQFPEAAEELKEASQCFLQEKELIMQMCNPLGGFGMSEAIARNLAKPGARNEIAGIVLQCRDWDQQAAEHIKRALTILQ